MKSSRVVCFGEIMMRLNPPGFQRFVQATSFEASYAGGEANVAVSLANYGEDAAYVTKLPANDLGYSARNAVRQFGVDTSGIVFGGPRLGTYYVEKGASQRPSKVIYDRAGSSIQTASRKDFDWETILKGAKWFHFTGITPAIGGENPAICLDALKVCAKKGIKVSCDLNFRKKLWDSKTAEKVMTTLMPYVDVAIANESDMDDVFGIKVRGTDVDSGVLNKDGFIEAAKELSDRFGIKTVAITLRTSISASENNWSGMLLSGGKAYFAKEYNLKIVDRVGGGDSFGGGLIHALINGYKPQHAIEFAVAASCLKHSIEHDFNFVSVAEVESLVGGNASGRVQR